MKTLYEKAIKRYNDIMYTTGREHLTIGTKFSEETENWNLADMVAECKYQLDFRNELINDDMGYDAEDRAMLRRERAKYERFIERFEPLIGDMQCVASH